MRPTFATLASLALVVVIWLLDVLTPLHLAFSVFYIVPIAVTAWFVGLRAGVATAFLCALLWAVAEIIGKPAVPLWMHLWNGVTRGAIFVALGVLANLLRREREKLRAIDRQREEALSFVAHELRTSVGSIESGIPALLAAESLDLAQRKTLLSLLRQAHSLKRFTEDVLAVGRFEQGKVELQRRHLDLAELVAQATRDGSDPERIQLVLPTEAVPVEVDPDRLQLAIEHLLSNALKYSPAGSDVFVRVSAAEGRARVDVRDDGIGMSENDHALLFQKYGRVRNTRTADLLGVGLGLYVTRLLVEAHGGTVIAKSVGPGLGSTFSMTLPLAQAPRSHEASRPTQESPAIFG